MDTPQIEQMQQQLDELQQELLKLHPSTPRDNSPPTAAAAPVNPPLHGEAPPTLGLPGDHRPQQQQEQEQPAAPAGGLPGAAAADSWVQVPAGASPPADQERTQIPPPAAVPTPAAVDNTTAGPHALPPTAPQHTPMSSRSHKAPSDNADQTSRSQSPAPKSAVAAAAAADPVPAAAAVPAAGAAVDNSTSPTAVTSKKHDVATKDPAAPAAAQASAYIAISPAAVGAPDVNGQQHDVTTEPAADGTARSNSPGQVTRTPEAATGELLATPAGSAAPVAATHAVEPATESNPADVASPPPPPAAAAAAGGGSGRKRGKKHPKQPPPGAKAQLKGVFWDRKTGRWRSQLGYHNKKIFMGYYNTPQEAAVAYDKKAVELHGMLAKTNFPIHNYVQLLPDGVSTLPTAEMAIPQGKKQQPDTPGDPAAAAAADMSYESEGVAGVSTIGNTNLSEGQAAGGDSGLLSSDSQQQQQQQQQQQGADLSAAKGAGGSWQSLAAAAATAVGDGGIDVPVILAAGGAAAAAEGGNGSQAAAGRPVRSKRKLAAASGDLDSKAQDRAAAAAGTPPSDAGNTAMDVDACDPADTALTQPSRQQQKRPFTRGGTSRGRHDRPGLGADDDHAEIRGPRTRGRPRSASYQGLSGWQRSPEPEEDQQSPQPGYDTQRNRRGSYYPDEGLDGLEYQTQGAYQGSGYRRGRNEGLSRSSTSGGRGLGAVQGYSGSDQFEGLGSADLTAAQAIASLMQLGAADPEPETVQGYSTWRQQQQQPEFQDYGNAPGAQSGGRMISRGRGGYYTGFSSEPEEGWEEDQIIHDARHGPWQQQPQQQRRRRQTYGDGAPANGPNWQQPGYDSSSSRYGSKPFSHSTVPSTAAAANASWQQQYGSDIGQNGGYQTADAHGPSVPGNRYLGQRPSLRGQYPTAAPNSVRAWQQQQHHDEDESPLLQHAAALVALPHLAPSVAPPPPAAAAEGRDLGSSFDDLLQLVQSALAAADRDKEQQQQQQQQRERLGRDSRELTLIQQLQEALSRLQDDPHNDQHSAAAAPHGTYHQPAAAAAAGVRSEAQDTLISILTAAMAPAAAPAAAAAQPLPSYPTAAVATMHTPPAAPAPAAAAARSDVSSGIDLALIDEALLLLPPDQRDLINQHPSLKLLLAAVVGGGQSGASEHLDNPQQQQQQEESWQQQGSHTRYHRAQPIHSPPQAASVFKQPQARTPAAAAAAGRGILAHTPASNVPASNRSVTTHQLLPSPTPLSSYHHQPAISVAADTLPQSTRVKPSPTGHVTSGRGSINRGSFRMGAGTPKPASIVNPGGVTFRKGKPLRRWGSQGGLVSPSSPGSGRGSSLKLPGTLGVSPHTPAAAAAAAAGGGAYRGSSSSSPGFIRSSRPFQAAQPLQLPQLVPLPEMSQPSAVQQQQQPADQQQQHGGDSGSDLGGLISALVEALQPQAPTAAAAEINQYPDAADFEPPSKRSKLSPPTHTPNHKLESPRETKPKLGPGSAAVYPLLGPITPAPSISAPQQAGHFIYTPPGACNIASPAAGGGGGGGGEIEAPGIIEDAGGDVVMHPAMDPDPDHDDQAVDVMVQPALSFNEWGPAATSPAMGLLQPPPPPAAVVAAAAAGGDEVGVLDPTRLLQTALTALQAVSGSAAALAAAMPSPAAAPVAQGPVKMQQHQMLLQDHGLQLHVLPPRGMLLPGQVRELQAAAAAVGGSSSSAAHPPWLADPTAVLSAVEGLPALLSEGGVVAEDVWGDIARILGTVDGVRAEVATAAAAAAAGVEREESMATGVQQESDADVAVRVHLEVMQGNPSQQQQQRKRSRGHLVLLPVVVPLVAAAAAATKTEAHLIAAEVAGTAVPPTHQEPDQQQQQQSPDLPDELAHMPAALRWKVTQLRDQVAAMQGGALTPKQDTNWLLRQMVAAVRRKVEAKQQLLQQSEQQDDLADQHQQQPLAVTAKGDGPSNLELPATLPAAAAAVGDRLAPTGLGSSNAGSSRAITTGIDISTVSNLQQLLARAAAGLRRDGAAQPGATGALQQDANNAAVQQL